MGNNDDGPRARGDKLAPLRTLLDRPGRLPQRARSALQGHARAWCRPLLEEAPVWRAGELLLAARGWLDGATRSTLKRQRPGAGLIPRQATRLATQEASPLAERANTWPPPPSRAGHVLALVRGVEPRWTACKVPLHACGIRVWHTTQKCPDPLGLLTTELTLCVVDRAPRRRAS